MHISWPKNHSFENFSYRKTKGTNIYVGMHACMYVCVCVKEKERIEKISRCKGYH